MMSTETRQLISLGRLAASCGTSPLRVRRALACLEIAPVLQLDDIEFFPADVTEAVDDTVRNQTRESRNG